MSEHQPDTGGHCLKHTVGVGKGASTRPNTVPRTNTVTKSYCVPGSRHKRAVEKKNWSDKKQCCQISFPRLHVYDVILVRSMIW